MDLSMSGNPNNSIMTTTNTAATSEKEKEHLSASGSSRGSAGRNSDMRAMIEKANLPNVDEWNLMVTDMEEQWRTTCSQQDDDSPMWSASPGAQGKGSVWGDASTHSDVKEIAAEKKLVRVAMTPSIGNIIEASMHVFQGVAVYASVMQFPLVYKLGLAKLFEFFAFDWSVAFNLEQLVTPVMQFAVALIVVLLIVYVAVMDDRRFTFNIGKFTRLRDQEDAADEEERQAVKERCLGLETLLTMPPEMVVLAQLMTPLDRLRVHRFVNRLGPDDKPLDKSVECLTLAVRLADGRKAQVARNFGGDVVIRVTHEVTGAAIPEQEKEQNTFPLKELGCCCPEHGRYLTETVQNDVYPYVNRKTCCAVEGTEPCNRHIGPMYVCGKRTVTEDGKVHVCNYAICARHWHPTLKDTVCSRTIGLFRVIETHGTIYLLAQFLLMLFVVLCTPFMRTVIMVLTCHPFFQCSFGKCWEDITPDFTDAAYVTIVTLVVFGVGAPVFCVITLARRYSYMRKSFRREEGADSPYVDEKGNVELLEWVRFLTSDDSAISHLYNQLLPQRMGFVPLFLLFKLCLLLPAILIEPNAINQLIAMGGLEIAFALFTLFSSPYMSPWIDLIYRIGCAHQLATLGFLSFYNIEEVDGKKVGADAGTMMVGLSLMYMLFVFVYFIGVVLKQPIATQFALWRHRMILRKTAIPPATLAPLYYGNVGGKEVIRSDPPFKEPTVLEDEEIGRMQSKALQGFKRIALAMISTIRMNNALKSLGLKRGEPNSSSNNTKTDALLASMRKDGGGVGDDGSNSDDEVAAESKDKTAPIQPKFTRKGTIASGFMWGFVAKTKKKAAAAKKNVAARHAFFSDSESDDSGCEKDDAVINTADDALATLPVATTSLDTSPTAVNKELTIEREGEGYDAQPQATSTDNILVSSPREDDREPLPATLTNGALGDEPRNGSRPPTSTECDDETQDGSSSNLAHDDKANAITTTSTTCNNEDNLIVEESDPQDAIALAFRWRGFVSESSASALSSLVGLKNETSVFLLF